jgi:hypothetical protein
MTRNAKHWRRMALWAERKGDEAAASTEPWALGNLRTYQNFASLWWKEHYRAAHAEELEASIAFQEAGME